MVDVHTCAPTHLGPSSVLANLVMNSQEIRGLVKVTQLFVYTYSIHLRTDIYFCDASQARARTSIYMYVEVRGWARKKLGA